MLEVTLRPTNSLQGNRHVIASGLVVSNCTALASKLEKRAMLALVPAWAA